MTVPRHDASNLAGIGILMNKDNVKPDIDIEKATADVMGKKVKRERNSELDPIKLYNMEMSNLANEIGISLDESPTDIKNNFKQNSKPSVSSSGSEWSSSGSGSESGSGSGSEYSYDSEYDTDVSMSSGYDSSAAYSQSSRGSIRSSRSSRSQKSSRSRRSERRSSRHNITNEQDRRSQIHSVMSDLRTQTTTSYGIENERIMDLKIQKLELIDTLKTQLTDDGISVTTAGDPTVSSSLEEIDATLKILTLKADRSRYSTIFEESLLCCAEAFETVFDGTRTIPVIGWTPDYTGYASNLSGKLVRCRGATSTIVGDIIEKHSISPGTRLMMELLPSFLLYPHMNAKTKNKTSLHSEFTNRNIGYIHAAEKQDQGMLNDL